MNNNLKPQLLTDKSRLQEIYDLRVIAYEHSYKSEYVNRQLFPNGWFDNLDERIETLHFIIEVEGKIIAAARLAILDNVKDTKENFDKFELPNERPFAYWSRLVVHPNYRLTPAMIMLDNVRKMYLIDNPNIKFALCWVTEDRVKSVLRVGFKHLGNSTTNYGGGLAEQAISMFVLELNKQNCL